MHNGLVIEFFMGFIVIYHIIIHEYVSLLLNLFYKAVHDVQQSPMQHTVFHHSYAKICMYVSVVRYNITVRSPQIF